MASQYHKMKYPYLYADPGLAKAVTGSGITPLLLSQLEEGGKYGPRVDYGGSGKGIDPLNLAGVGGKGTGLDLMANPDNPLFSSSSDEGILNLIPSMTTEQLIEGGKLPDSLKGPDIELKPRPTEEDIEAARERIEGGEEEEEEEIKTGKDYGELGFFQKLLKAATENPEATLALGRALLKGEGLGIGLADFAEEKIAQDKEEAALEKEAEETLYERKLKEREFQLDVAKAEDLARYYEQMGYSYVAKTDRPLKEIEYGVYYAQLQRDSEGKPLKPGTAEFDEKVIEGMDRYAKNNKDSIMEFFTGGQTDQDSQQVGTATVGNNTINVPYQDLGK